METFWKFHRVELFLGVLLGFQSRKLLSGAELTAVLSTERSFIIEVDENLLSD